MNRIKSIHKREISVSLLWVLCAIFDSNPLIYITSKSIVIKRKCEGILHLMCGLHNVWLAYLRIFKFLVSCTLAGKCWFVFNSVIWLGLLHITITYIKCSPITFSVYDNDIFGSEFIWHSYIPSSRNCGYLIWSVHKVEFCGRWT